MENVRRLFHRKAKDPARDSSSSTSSLAATLRRKKAFPSGIKLLYDAENSVVDIIFVHGLTGDREKTWTAKGAASPWPHTLLPAKVANARILTFGYDAYVADWRGMVSKNRIGNHSMNLLTAVATYRENDDTNNRPIIFVCHSLGGLVCEDALVGSGQRPEDHLRSILYSTRGIIFLGTPHHGSGLAEWAEKLARSIGVLKQTNSEIVAVLKRDSEVLARIQDSFHAMIRSRSKDGLWPIEITCFYEELPLPGVGVVVPSHSAILPGYIPIGIQSNHMDMTKFEGEDDPGFAAVTGELRRWVKGVAVHGSSRPTAAAISQQQQEERQRSRSFRTGVKHFGITSANSGAIVGDVSGQASVIGSQINYYQTQGNGRPETPTHPSCNLPFRRDPDFIDRGSLLDQIREKCSVPAARVALVGLGGVGKSQLAIEHCYRIREKSPETWVFWVHASNNARLEQSYREVAELAKIPGRNDAQANIFQLVSKWLRNEKNGQWMIVLDNADDASVICEAQTTDNKAGGSNRWSAQPFSTYLPQTQNGSVLVTTRTRSVAYKLVEENDVIAVEPMDDTHAVALLERKLDGQSNGKDTAELAAALEFMPLAIVQAAAYIRQRAPRCSVLQYLEDFYRSDRKKTSLLDYEAGNLRRDHEAKNSIIITWQISFDHVRQERPSAADLLSLMSFFDRQGIPQFLLKRQHEAEDGNRNVDKEDEGSRHEESSGEEDAMSEFEYDILMLRNYSFLTANADGATFEMHALVQLATRKWLKAHGHLERWKQQYIKNLCTVFPVGEHENWIICRALFPHAKSAEAQRPTAERSLREWASILHNAAWYALAIGKYVEAERMSKSAMRARETVLGREHIKTLGSMGMLASTFWNQGRWKEAEELEVQVMETFKRVLGEEHPSTLTSMANLASTYRNQGRWKEAEELEVQVMETRKRVLGEEHPDTLTSMANLASTFWNQGRWKEAEELQAIELKICSRVLGEEHPSTLTSMANLAFTLKSQRRNEEAVSLMLNCLQLRKQILGHQHPDIETLLKTLNKWQMKNLEIRL